MNNWSAPQQPNDYAEQSLVTAILEGTFAPDERALAAEPGVHALRPVSNRA
jgi:hypothetical protein